MQVSEIKIIEIHLEKRKFQSAKTLNLLRKTS